MTVEKFRALEAGRANEDRASGALRGLHHNGVRSSGHSAGVDVNRSRRVAAINARNCVESGPSCT